MNETPTTCPRCAAAIAPGQEYCLGCGARLPAVARLAVRHESDRTLPLRVLVLGAFAIVGAALAIGLTRDADASVELVTATGGSIPVDAPDDTGARLTPWPVGKDAWTIVLASVPKVDGSDEAVALAEAARRRGLTPAGVLDSSRYPSLRPGYWMAYTGVYRSEAEANGAVRDARPVARTARVERVAG